MYARRKREGATENAREGLNTPPKSASQQADVNNRPSNSNFGPASKLTRRLREEKIPGSAFCRMAIMRYEFLVETYGTERIKVVSVWSEFRDEDLPVRPRQSDSRGRSVHEQMVHQCVSESLWFINMLGIDVGAPPLPAVETRLEFMKRYTEDSGKRLPAVPANDDGSRAAATTFFEVQPSGPGVT